MQYSTNPYLAVAQLMGNSYLNTMDNARGYEDFGQAFKRQHGLNSNAEMLRYILDRANQQFQNAPVAFYNPRYYNGY